MAAEVGSPEHRHDLWSLPTLVLRKTFDLVDIQTLGRGSLVARAWANGIKQVSSEPSFWRSFCKTNVVPVGEELPSNISCAKDLENLCRGWCTGIPAETTIIEDVHGKGGAGSMRKQINGIGFEPWEGISWSWTVGNDLALRAVDLERSQEVVDVEDAHQSAVQALAFLGNRTICTVGSDKQLKLWDMRCLGEHPAGLIASVQAHMDEVYCVEPMNPGSSDPYIFTGGGDEVAYRWDKRDLSEPVTAYEGHSGTVYCLSPHLSQGVLYTGGGDRKINRFDIETGEWLTELIGHGGDVHSLVAGTERLMSCSDDGTIREWSLADSQDAPEEQSPLSTLGIRLDGINSRSTKTSISTIKGLGSAPQGVVVATWEGPIMVAQRFGRLKPLGVGLERETGGYVPVTCLDATATMVVNGFANGSVRLSRMVDREGVAMKAPNPKAKNL
ncbi:hypothetical protein BSKO_07195 [Bryopsis sp. KO-2023]|nr:hypothetical protein BSKO_07195 [Bryopsis sp. KO-2023]